MNKLEKRVRALLEQASSQLQKKDIEFADDNIKHKQYDLAFELICVQLFEHDAIINLNLYKEIEEIGRIMNIDSSSWRFLEQSLKP